MHIVLVEPEIPQNTGNIARTCAATGSVLHLVHPLGFAITDRGLKRAGLDYWHLLDIRMHENLEAFLKAHAGGIFRLATTKAPNNYCEVEYPEESFLLFGKETAGLPAYLLEQYRNDCVRIPMRDGARSLNLSNSVAVVLYEALRQQQFDGLKLTGGMK
jgi:tRNA (cytidine/uridine-2'-O-)-methyltransferase